MIYRNYPILIVLISLFFFAGCAKQLTRDLQGSFSLEYMQDSKICEQKTPTRIAIGKITNEAKLHDSTYARALYFVPIPLVFVNVGVSGYICKLGQSAFDTQLESFLRDAFIKESQRSGCFEIVNDGSEEFAVDLTIIDHETKGPYTKYFYMYFAMYIYGYGFGQKAGPGETNITLKMDLIGKNGKNISRQFESRTRTEMLRGKNDAKELRRNYVIGMVESVSFAFKECIDNSIVAINEYLKGTDVTVGQKSPKEQIGDIEVHEE